MILTLPITPRRVRALGYWLTPFLGDVLQQRMQEQLAIGAGLLGARTDAAVHLADFQRDLDFLGVEGELWRDEIHSETLQHRLEALAREADIRETNDEYYVCGCGLLELPVAHAELHRLKAKTFVREGDVLSCAVCHTRGEIVRSAQLIMRFSPERVRSLFGAVRIMPEFYRRELGDLLQQIAYHGIRITRARPTGFAYRGFTLDIEFLWQHQLLCFNTASRLVLVVNNHVLRQALIALLLFREGGCAQPVDILIAPYLVHPGKTEKWTIDRLADLGHDRLTIRFMLAHSLSWKEKQILLNDEVSRIEYRRFMLLWRRITEHPDTLGRDAATLPRDLSRQTLTQALKHVFNPERFEYAKLRGLA